MTDTEKVALISKMISDTIEFTAWEYGELNALIGCIDAVCGFHGADES